MDNVVWKLEVYQVMLGMSDKKASDFSNHKLCRLGQWYYQGEGAEKYASNTSFKQLEVPHSQVHTHGLNALKSMNSGDMEQAVKELAVMEKASVDVINLLTALSHDISRESGL
ncbi:MAG: CZB domain-containing protein [Colwellia sp.]